MTDSFNTYFSTICATSEIDNPDNIPSHDVHVYLNNPTDTEFNFERIDNMMVLHYINKLKPSQSYGHDNISSNVLKIIAIEVSPCLTLIRYNQVLSTGQFPKNLKTAKVIPIHKTGEKTLMKNYRTISIYIYLYFRTFIKYNIMVIYRINYEQKIINEQITVPKHTWKQGWGQVQLTKYSSTPSTPNIYQVQVLVKYSFF